MSTIPSAPKGHNTVNPFIFTKDARKFMDFVKDVFGAVERKEAFTTDSDGLILHGELEIGDAVLMCVDRKPNWPNTPAFIQVYVDDVEKTLAKAEACGGKIITKPTDFYGDIFSRMLDPHGNLWWVYKHNSDITWEDSGDANEGADWDESNEGLTYIHKTIMDVMPTLGKDK